jgi:dihydrofolate reductase
MPSAAISFAVGRLLGPMRSGTGAPAASSLRARRRLADVAEAISLAARSDGEPCGTRSATIPPPMARLIYSAICSLDGYIEGADGRFEWAAPGEEVHAFISELERPVGTYLYGRRMYETLVYWETADTGDSAVLREWSEIWKAAEKVVYSRTLTEVSSARTRIERDFDTDAIRRLKQESRADLTVGGPELAGQALAAGLVDELQLFLHPVVVGGGKHALPAGVRLALELVDERRFTGGVVFLRYHVGAS